MLCDTLLLPIQQFHVNLLHVSLLLPLALVVVVVVENQGPRAGRILAPIEDGHERPPFQSLVRVVVGSHVQQMAHSGVGRNQVDVEMAPTAVLQGDCGHHMLEFCDSVLTFSVSSLHLVGTLLATVGGEIQLEMVTRRNLPVFEV